MRALEMVLRSTLVLILLTSGYFKASDFAELEATLALSGLMLPGWEVAAGVCLIGAEFVIALILLVPKFALIGLFGAAGLSSLFFGYALWRLYQDIKAPCGCFGFLFQLSSGQSLLLTVAMCASALGCIRIRRLRHIQAPSPLLGRRVTQ